MNFLQKLNMIATLRCREASRLLSQSEDTPLARHERIALRFHLFICGSCRRFGKQLELLRHILRTLAQRARDGQPPTNRLSKEARQRFLKRFRNALRRRP